jgi:hypothetical protein
MQDTFMSHPLLYDLPNHLRELQIPVQSDLLLKCLPHGQFALCRSPTGASHKVAFSAKAKDKRRFWEATMPDR